MTSLPSPAAFEAELVELERVTDPPEAPLAWGQDLSCVDDVREDFGETAAGSPRILAEALVRRLTTPRGALLDDPDYGIDLRSYCNRGVTLEDLRSLQARARAEATKDERIESVSLTVTTDPAGSSIRLEPRIAPADPNTKPFAFVVSVTDATVLLELEQGE
jgi:hypothetical protein